MTSNATSARARRGRKPKDPQVILDALEELLAERDLHELNIEDILGRAGVARATFYLHFDTKYAAAAALFDQVVDELTGSMAAFVERPEGTPVTDAMRQGVDASTAVWFRHRVIFGTVIQNAHIVPEFGQTLARIKREYTNAVAIEIERERDAGLAPPGPDALPLCAALVECTLHLLYASGRGETKHLRGRKRIGDIIMTLWSSTFYCPRAPDV
jgi:AcrR family transcriptional regulator